MQTGDLVWFLQTNRGGYGFQKRVPAVFVHATDRRFQIEVLLRDGGLEDHQRTSPQCDRTARR